MSDRKPKPAEGFRIGAQVIVRDGRSEVLSTSELIVPRPEPDGSCTFVFGGGTTEGAGAAGVLSRGSRWPTPFSVSFDEAVEHDSSGRLADLGDRALYFDDLALGR